MIGLQYGLLWKCWENSIPFMGYIIIMFASSKVAIFWIVPHFQTPKWLSQKMQVPWFGRLANGLRTTCWRIAILLPCSRQDFESSWALPENWLNHWLSLKWLIFVLEEKELPFSVAIFSRHWWWQLVTSLSTWISLHWGLCPGLFAEQTAATLVNGCRSKPLNFTFSKGIIWNLHIQQGNHRESYYLRLVGTSSSVIQMLKTL